MIKTSSRFFYGEVGEGFFTEGYKLRYKQDKKIIFNLLLTFINTHDIFISSSRYLVSKFYFEYIS